MNPANIAVTPRVQDILTAIEQSVTNTKRAKSLIRQINEAKAAGKYVDPEVQQAYITRINNSLRVMLESHTIVNPERANWTDRVVKVIKKLEELSGEAMVKTSDDKIFTLSPEQLKNIGTIRELKSDMTLPAGVIPLDLIHSITLEKILLYLVSPESVVITPANMVDLYSAAIHLDITSPTPGDISLSEKCLKSAEHLLKLKDFTSEFCGNPGFAHFFRSISDVKKTGFIKEYRSEVNLLSANYKAIAPYLSFETFIKEKPEDTFRKFMAPLYDKNNQLKNLKKITVGLRESDFSDDDIKYIKALPKNIEVSFLLSKTSKYLGEICTIPNLTLLAFDAKKDIDCSFLPSGGMENIKKVSIRNLKSIRADTLSMLATKCDKLEDLRLPEVDFVELPIGFPELKRLNISKNSKLTSEGLQMAVNYPKLEELDITYCTGVKTVSPKLPKTFKKLYAFNSGLSDAETLSLPDRYNIT